MRGLFWLAMAPLLVAAACAPTPEPGSNGEAPALLPSLQASTDGGAVLFMLQVTNTAEEPIPLDFSSGQSYDFVVRDGEREVWRWSADQMFTQALRSEVVAPGETLTYEATWTPPAGLSGEFTVTGRLTARNRPVEQAARFRIP